MSVVSDRVVAAQAMMMDERKVMVMRDAKTDDPTIGLALIVDLSRLYPFALFPSQSYCNCSIQHPFFV